MSKSKPVSPKKSNSKGSGFERSVARSLSSWLYGDSKFLYRSRGSGSLYTRNSYKSEVSDISPIKTNIFFPFGVECKNRESDCCPSYLFKLGSKSKLFCWFSQNEKDALDMGLFPLLVFKKNFSPSYIMFRGFEGIDMDGGIYKFPLFGFNLPGEKVFYVSKFDDFIQGVSGPKFLKHLKLSGYNNYGS